MRIDIDHFSIGQIGDILAVGDDSFGWVTVEISFKWDANTAHPSFDIRVPIEYRRDWTVDQVRAAAWERAVAVVRFLADRPALDDLAGFQSLSDERRRHQGLPEL